MPSRDLPKQPSPAAKLKIRLALSIVRWPLLALLRYRGTKLSWSGTENLPSNKPVLVVSNHVNQLDPAMLILSSNQPIHFLATQAILQEPRLARICKFFGVVFKKKFTTDLTAIRSLQAWNKVGATVGLFPEGERSWDGRLLPLVSGTERLVTLLKVPLVTARIINADRIWPRWSPHPRSGRVHIEFDPPVAFEKNTPFETIRQHIIKKITIEHNEGSTWLIHGQDLASGLANPLFACPQCLQCNSLSEQGDEVHCINCTAGWRVNSENSLNGLDSTPSMTISTAIDRIRQHLNCVNWRPYPEQFETDESLLSSESMELWNHSQEPFFRIGSGVLKLKPSRLVLAEEDGTELWSIPLSAIRTVSVELRRRLQFRTQDQLFEARIPRESVVLWEIMTRHWINAETQPVAPKQRLTPTEIAPQPSIQSE